MATATKAIVKKTKKVVKKVDPGETYIAVVLDKSGSMSSIKSNIIELFNDQVRTIHKESKAAKSPTKVSMVQFSTNVEKPTYWNAPVEQMTELTSANYQPEGNTALYDAVGDTITSLESYLGDYGKKHAVLVLIVSDGEENNSKTWTAQVLADKIGKLKAKGNWTFVFLGSNVDLAQVSKTMNIPIHNTQSFVHSAAGTQTASYSTASSTATYYAQRGMGRMSVSNFYSPDDVTMTQDEDWQKSQSQSTAKPKKS